MSMYINVQLAYAEILGWSVLAVCVLVAYALLGIDSVAAEIESPFGHDKNNLPLSMICDTIEKNVLEILNRHQHLHRDRAMSGMPAVW